MIDPGAHTEVVREQGYGRFAGAIVSVSGFLLLSLILGVVVDATRVFLARIAEGRSEVVETGHFLVIGYSEKCIPIVAEVLYAWFEPFHPPNKPRVCLVRACAFVRVALSTGAIGRFVNDRSIAQSRCL